MIHPPAPPPRPLVVATVAYAPAWTCALCAWVWLREWPTWPSATVLAVAFLLAAIWGAWGWRRRKFSETWAAVAASIGYLLAWPAAVFFADIAEWSLTARSLTQFGTAGLFFLGLGWVIWGVEKASRRFELKRLEQADQSAEKVDHEVKPLLEQPRPRGAARIWNPLDPLAWYYGGHSRKLNQSLTALVSYSLLFFIATVLLSQTQGCSEVYEMPAGGGQVKQLAQTVRIQKVIRKKFVVNPYSAIKFDVPPIDEVKLQLNEITEHAYSVGYGEGQGAGFAGGTSKGKVRLIRLEYSGGDWDLNFGVGADLNMLVEYGVRTSQRVAEQTESRTILDLRGFPAGKAPPVVFLTGQKSISVTNAEIKTLREYLDEKHGMLFASNGGSGHFHQQFLALMNQVVPDVRPVPVPLDDPIHALPYRMAAVPIVAPHGGRDALGWYKDGRWICYYHPGDISDAWCDDHAGVSADVWEACYQLGVNVLFYAHAEQAKWLEAKKK